VENGNAIGVIKVGVCVVLWYALHTLSLVESLYFGEPGVNYAHIVFNPFEIIRGQLFVKLGEAIILWQYVSSFSVSVIKLVEHLFLKILII